MERVLFVHNKNVILIKICLYVYRTLHQFVVSMEPKLKGVEWLSWLSGENLDPKHIRPFLSSYHLTSWYLLTLPYFCDQTFSGFFTSVLHFLS